MFIIFVIQSSNFPIMARPIKDTPILSGKDAERFIDRMSRSDERRETDEERRKRVAVFEATMKMFHTRG